MFPNLSADIKRYIKEPKDNIYLIFEQGVWAIVVYRFGRWTRTVKIPLVSLVFKIISFLLFKSIEIITGISLPVSAEIGKGLYIGHFGCIILHSNVKMGENCSIVTGVTIGTRGLGNTGVPVIGDNVYMGVVATILGGIKIGNNSNIGAGIIIAKDIGDNKFVYGKTELIIKENEAKLDSKKRDMMKKGLAG